MSQILVHGKKIADVNAGYEYFEHLLGANADWLLLAFQGGVSVFCLFHLMQYLHCHRQTSML